MQDNDTYDHFIGKTVKLGADISVTRMAGSSGHEFMGTFDGQGHTLTVDYTTTAQITAPFRYVNGATIMNLTTGGTINTSAKFAGGIVGTTLGVGTVEITNCVSGVSINSSVNGDGTHGGLLAVASYGAVNFTGCMFSGEMLGESTTLWGGFVGWTESNHNATVTFTDCLFNPTNLTTNSGRTFARARNMSSVTITNCYYIVSLGAAQGYPAVSDPNRQPAGNPTGTYPLSNLTAYVNGLLYGDTFYYNPESNVTQRVTLLAGWNWFSTYIEADDLLNQLKASLGTNGMSINTQGAVLVYRNGMWMGGMSSIENKKGYKIRTSVPVEVTIEGQIINPANCPITITQGANWIGYPLPVSQTVGNALAGFTPSNGDVIMTQGGTTVYRSGHWMPATFTFEPGKAYIYKSTSSSPKTLIFSNSK